MRPPIIRASFLEPDELVVVHFAGGGGATKGIEQGSGRDADIAINHSAEAIAMHRANHPRTKHYCEDVWKVDPHEACRGRRVGFAWFSPDCTFFSRAKGGKPRDKKVRALAWVVIRWARAVRPRVIVLENVPEFEDWGPLDENNMPDPKRAGLSFRIWLGKLRALGYAVEWRMLVSADYGAPTTRKRLFLIARCDGMPIVWPEPTHANRARNQLELLGVSSRLPAWRGAHEIIDWSIECPSIFDRKRPLAEATLQRIADGLRRYVVDSPEPFVIPLTHQGKRRAHPLSEPLPTITGANRGELALIAPMFTKAFGGPNGNGNAGVDPRQPIGTVTTRDHHWLVAARLTRSDVHPAMHAFITKYYGTGVGQSLGEPLHTITSKARFGLVTVRGERHAIADIGYRMLSPRELFNAQGFPPDFVIDPMFDGAPLTKTAQIELVGNSVSPPVAREIVAANCGRGLEAVA